MRGFHGGPSRLAVLVSFVLVMLAGVPATGMLAGATGNPMAPSLADRRAPLDTTPPVTSAEISGAVGSNGWYNSPVIVTLTATDADSNVSGSWFRVDEDAFQPYTGPFSVTTEGTHRIDFYSMDDVGNTEDVRSTSASIDSELPTAIATLQGTLGTSSWYRSAVTVSLAASDATSGVAALEHRADAGEWQLYAGPFELGEGGHTLEYRATDFAGLVKGDTLAVRVDGTAPACGAFLGGMAGDDGWWRSDVVLTLSCADAASGLMSVEYRIGSGSWTGYLGPTSLPLEDGPHSIGYRATDAAGNLGESAVIARVDRTPPSVSIVPSSAGPWLNTSSVSVQWTAGDATSGVDRFEVRVDGGSPQTVGSAEITLEGLEDGTHYLRVRAIDAAGNVADADAAVGVDTQAPVLTVGSPAQGGVVTEPRVRILGSAVDFTSGIEACTVSLDGQGIQPANLPDPIAFESLADGAHVVRIACADLAGNVAVVTRTFTVVTDPLNPSGPYGPWLLAFVVAIPLAVAGAAIARMRRRRTARTPPQVLGEEGPPTDADELE